MLLLEGLLASTTVMVTRHNSCGPDICNVLIAIKTASHKKQGSAEHLGVTHTGTLAETSTFPLDLCSTTGVNNKTAAAVTAAAAPSSGLSSMPDGSPLPSERCLLSRCVIACK